MVLVYNTINNNNNNCSDILSISICHKVSYSNSICNSLSNWHSISNSKSNFNSFNSSNLIEKILCYLFIFLLNGTKKV